MSIQEEIFCQKCIIFVAHKQTSGETRFFIKFVCHINRSNLRRSFQLQKKLQLLSRIFRAIKSDRLLAKFMFASESKSFPPIWSSRVMKMYEMFPYLFSLSLSHSLSLSLLYLNSHSNIIMFPLLEYCPALCRIRYCIIILEILYFFDKHQEFWNLNCTIVANQRAKWKSRFSHLRK